jgi:hypothetical protein
LDTLVGSKGYWRAELTLHHGRQLPAARVDDLVLLKLYAGGSQDRWDIEQLLARPDRAVIIDAVERSLSQLPADAQRLWRALAL